jgi:CspA family cold shock protein
MILGGVRMYKGKVKWFNDWKGYGVITREDGSDLFVHYSDIEGSGFRVLSEGEEVEFDIVKSDRGLKAIHVTRKE